MQRKRKKTERDPFFFSASSHSMPRAAHERETSKREPKGRAFPGCPRHGLGPVYRKELMSTGCPQQGHRCTVWMPA